MRWHVLQSMGVLRCCSCSCRSWRISWSTNFRNERRSAQKQPEISWTWVWQFLYWRWRWTSGFMLHGFQRNAYDWIRFPPWQNPPYVFLDGMVGISFPLPGDINTRHNRWANLGSEPCHLHVVPGTSTGGYSWPMRRIVRTSPICLMWSAYACLPVLWQCSDFAKNISCEG